MPAASVYQLNVVLDAELAVSVVPVPEHTVAACVTGASGIGLTVTVTSVRKLEQPFTVLCTQYFFVSERAGVV